MRVEEEYFWNFKPLPPSQKMKKKIFFSSFSWVRIGEEYFWKFKGTPLPFIFFFSGESKRIIFIKYFLLLFSKTRKEIFFLWRLGGLPSVSYIFFFYSHQRRIIKKILLLLKEEYFWNTRESYSPPPSEKWRKSFLLLLWESRSRFFLNFRKTHLLQGKKEIFFSSFTSLVKIEQEYFLKLFKKISHHPFRYND